MTYNSLSNTTTFHTTIIQNVCDALAEDIGSGDITAQLVPKFKTAKAQLICREPAVLCGSPWFEETFRQLNQHITFDWDVIEGEVIEKDQVIVALEGNARNILTAERTALNFLQFLSGTATVSREYFNLVKHTGVTLLDTRKTLPGLRVAQKYAVAIGGCSNHRIGLYDAFLIKENHINSCGSIAAAITAAREQAPEKPVEIEVENLHELESALAGRAEVIMLDNFSIRDLIKAVNLTAGQAKLEASGGITKDNLLQIAETGVDFISLGTLTKHNKAVDLSMRILI